MSQESNTPSESYTKAAIIYHDVALKTADPKRLCQVCHHNPWFVISRFGNKMCKDCFEFLLIGLQMKVRQ